MFLGPDPGAASAQAASRAQSGVRGSGTSVPLEQAFASASQATGLPFDYFMTMAMRESSLDVNAAATTSSARGPFQFIEQTWLSMVHQHGQALGLGQEAAAIERRSDGRFQVDDPAAREAVLAMRHDPQLSAVMSGLYLMGNASDLQNALGRDVTVGEGYVAHVFGSSGASRLIALAEQQPGRVAADVFPTAAAANRGLFYDRSGEAVSVRQLYDRLVQGFPADPVPTRPPASLAVAPAALSGLSGLSASSAPTDGSPLDLEPTGFDALPQSEPIVPDTFAQLGLFSPAGGGSTPFFAALYRPDGMSAPHIGEEFVSTHGRSTPTQPVADERPAAPVPVPASASVQKPAPVPVGMPLDLLGFARSGQLSAAYTNPAQAAGRAERTELLPPL